MDGRFFRSFAEAEMGVIQANSSKNSSKNSSNFIKRKMLNS